MQVEDASDQWSLNYLTMQFIILHCYELNEEEIEHYDA